MYHRWLTSVRIFLTSLHHSVRNVSISKRKCSIWSIFFFRRKLRLPTRFMQPENYLCSHFEKYGRYTIAVGDTVYGLPKAYQTYTSAVILLQSGYFFPENSLLTSESLENIPDVQTNVFADTPAGCLCGYSFTSGC